MSAVPAGRGAGPLVPAGYRARLVDGEVDSALAAVGWVLLEGHYEDGGFSAKDLERPDIQRLIADIEAGQVDVVVVYKIDRLVRSLMDFAKLVELFDEHGVSFGHCQTKSA